MQAGDACLYAWERVSLCSLTGQRLLRYFLFVLKGVRRVSFTVFQNQNTNKSDLLMCSDILRVLRDPCEGPEGPNRSAPPAGGLGGCGGPMK